MGQKCDRGHQAFMFTFANPAKLLFCLLDLRQGPLVVKF
jgi:hypothetical protein